MRLPLLTLAAALASTLPALAQAPREQSPAPKGLLEQIGSGSSDAELESAVAAASVHPLGTLQNPVRVGGPEGERAYMARLRCADGLAPQIGARTDAGVCAFGSVDGAYSLDCGGAAPGTFTLVLHMYHAEHEENRAPAGFTLTSR